LVGLRRLALSTAVVMANARVYVCVSQNNYATIINKAGNPVRATPDAVADATVGATFNSRFVAVITDSPRPVHHRPLCRIDA